MSCLCNNGQLFVEVRDKMHDNAVWRQLSVITHN